MFKLKSMPKCHSNTSPRRTHKYILSILNDHLVFFFYIQRLLPYDPPHIYDMWSRALSILYIRCEHAHMWFYIYFILTYVFVSLFNYRRRSFTLLYTHTHGVCGECQFHNYIFHHRRHAQLLTANVSSIHIRNASYKIIHHY